TYRITVAEPQEWITAPWAPRGTSPATPPLPGTTRPDAVGPTTAPHGLTNNAPTTLGTTPHEHSPIGWWWWPAGTAMAFLAAGWFFLLALARRRRREDDEDTNQA
ncbi:MAG: hypothetical protein FWF28_07970, partial [Micrococcales bacterium]|nr:hypothetical protein [Micrococcales bacterium]